LKIISDYSRVAFSDRHSVAIGFFDGYHKGHRAVTVGAVKRGKELGYNRAVLTFEPPKGRKVLTTTEEKLEFLSKEGFEKAVVLPADGVWRRWSPRKFAVEFLCNRMNAGSVFVGSDFRFGKNRAGDIDALKHHIGKKNDREVNIKPLVFIEGNKISSSRIRKMIKDGKIKTAERMMGRHYFFTGKTIAGKGVGREIGFPTINFSLSQEKLIPRGVFTCRLLIDDIEDSAGPPGGCFIGKQGAAEVHLLKYTEGMEKKARGALFLKKIRNVRNFKTLSNLSNQIEKDMKAVEFDIQNTY